MESEHTRLLNGEGEDEQQQLQQQQRHERLVEVEQVNGRVTVAATKIAPPNTIISLTNVTEKKRTKH